MWLKRITPESVHTISPIAAARRVRRVASATAGSAVASRSAPAEPASAPGPDAAGARGGLPRRRAPCAPEQRRYPEQKAHEQLHAQPLARQRPDAREQPGGRRGQDGDRIALLLGGGAVAVSWVVHRALGASEQAVAAVEHERGV